MRRYLIHVKYWFIYDFLSFWRRMFGLGCLCGQRIFVEGYCVDCWPGYDNCARQNCGHYRCEHQFPGNEWSVSYSKDNPEHVGETYSLPVGCMVNDGPEHCAEFVEAGRESHRE